MLASSIDLPSVVGTIPEEYRDLFSDPLPIKGDTNQSRAYFTRWNNDVNPKIDDLHPDIQHLMPIIDATLTASGILVDRTDVLTLKIRQDDGTAIANETEGWHIDGGFGPGYRRVVVSDVYGTKYKTRQGNRLTTPDYGMLLIDAFSQHTAQKTPAGVVRTRLQISRLA